MRSLCGGIAINDAIVRRNSYTPDGKVLANAWPDPMDPWGMYGCGDGPCYMQVPNEVNDSLDPATQFCSHLIQRLLGWSR